MSQSAAEAAFRAAWDKIAPPGHDLTAEYQFDKSRKWRFDFCFPSQRVALEIHGRGRHQRVVGARQDSEKHNEAIRQGWALLWVPATDMRFADDWARMVLEVIIARGGQDVKRGSSGGAEAEPKQL